MEWNDPDELRDALELLDETIHAGAPRSPSTVHCLARITDVVDLVWPELDRLRALVFELGGTP